MPYLTLGGQPLTVASLASLGSYSVSPVSGTLTSGQTYVGKVPDSAPSRLGIVYLHGGFSTEAEINAGDMDVITDAVAAAGFPILAGNVGGDQWGSNLARTLIDELVAFLASDLNADLTHGVAIWGTSMGGANGLSWISQHMNETACFIGVAPLSSTQSVYGLPGGFGALLTASIDAAYGGAAAWAVAQPTHDATPLSESGVFEGLRYRAWYGLDDTVVTPNTVQHVAEEIGRTAGLVPISGLDHFDVAGGVNISRVIRYLAGSYPPLFDSLKSLAISI